MTDLTTLIAKLEAAKGPDRELDAEIAATFHYVSNMPDWVNNWSGKWGAAKSGRVYLMEDSGNRGPNFISDSFTDSIDAAVALAKHVLPGWRGSVQFGNFGGPVTAYACSDEDTKDATGAHSSPAIAIVIAILLAKQAEGKG